MASWLTAVLIITGVVDHILWPKSPFCGSREYHELLQVMSNTFWKKESKGVPFQQGKLSKISCAWLPS